MTGSLPPFLEPLTLSTSSPFPIESQYIHSKKLGKAPTHCLWWPSKHEHGLIDTVLLFVTGNPGLANFYIDYLNIIYEGETSGKLAIAARSLVGHSPKVGSVKSEHTSLQMQVEAHIEVLDSIIQTYGPQTRIILAGHSIGSWIILQATRQRREHVSCLFLLCPTIAHIATTPNGKRLSWLFKPPFPTTLSTLSNLLNPFLKPFLWALFRRSWPRHQFEVLWSFLTSPSSILSSLTLAHQEMLIVKDLDKALLEDVKPISYWLFAENDRWVGENEKAIIQVVVNDAEPNRVVQRPDIPHSFSIIQDHSDDVAGVTLAWLDHFRRIGT